jgi:type I restriction enzyme, S subunit
MIEWQKLSLCKVAEIDRDIVNPSEITEDTTYIGLENIETGGLFVNVRKVKKGELASSKFAFTEKHILYGKLRPYLAKIARPTFSGICSTDILPILPKSEIDRDYLTHFLSQSSMIELATSRSTGANLPRLSPKVLSEFSIVVPPIDQQKRIAAILDKAEELRSLRRQSIEQLDILSRSIFIEMFGDPVTNPKGWNRFIFSDLISKIESGHSPNCLDRPKTDQEWGVLKLGAVTWCDYNQSENKALPPHEKPHLELEVKVGDLLFVRKNTYELVAASVLVRSTMPKLLLPDLIFRLRLNSDAPINSCFLHKLLINPSKRREIQKLASGAASSMPNISKAKLYSVLIEVPPLSLQQEFAQRIKAIEHQKSQHRESLAQLDKLFASLQHRAFRGEL